MIREMPDEHDEVPVKSTGGAGEFWNMLERLRDAAHLLPIRVDAPFDLCLERIRSRDQSLQIPVSDEMIRRMDQLSRNVECDFVAVIRNADLTDPEIMEIVELVGEMRRARKGAK